MNFLPRVSKLIASSVFIAALLSPFNALSAEVSVDINLNEGYTASVINAISTFGIPCRIANVDTHTTRDRSYDSKYGIIHLHSFEEDLLLVVNMSSLYVEGFISQEGVYYFFQDSNIKTAPIVDKDGKTLAKSTMLLSYDPNYNALIGCTDFSIDDAAIISAFQTLVNFAAGKNQDSLRRSVAIIIAATTESMRFLPVRQAIDKTINGGGTLPSWQKTKEALLINWPTMSRQALGGDKSALKTVTLIQSPFWGGS